MSCGCRFTVTASSKVSPGQLLGAGPVGVIVYVRVIGAKLSLVNVPEITFPEPFAGAGITPGFEDVALYVKLFPVESVVRSLK